MARLAAATAGIFGTTPIGSDDYRHRADASTVPVHVVEYDEPLKPLGPLGNGRTPERRRKNRAGWNPSVRKAKRSLPGNSSTHRDQWEAKHVGISGKTARRQRIRARRELAANMGIAY